jgi:Saxitoxin biosynthesis operon protein SxtJ
MIEIPWHPPNRMLRRFAAIWLPLFAALVGFWVGRATGRWDAVRVGWVVTAALAAGGLVWPPFVRPVFLGLILLTFPIGWVVSHALLTAIFVLVFTPIGLARRLLGHDALDLRDRPGRTSLWRESTATQPPERYTRPH